MGTMNKRPPLPDCLPWFRTVNRYWDAKRKRYVAKLLPGEYYVTMDDELITTVLGSCIAACVRDPLSGIGGMNHFMLPSSMAGQTSLVSEAFRYGNFAMEHLINDIMKLANARESLEFKIFGGANVMGVKTTVGKRNIDFVKDYLKLEQFNVAASDVGGSEPRKILYDPSSGVVLMKRIDNMRNETILMRERKYREELDRVPVVTGEVDLF